jgi:hypothetical protein
METKLVSHKSSIFVTVKVSFEFATTQEFLEFFAKINQVEKKADREAETVATLKPQIVLTPVAEPAKVTKPTTVKETKVCALCETTETPQWRKHGVEIVCNACKMREKRKSKAQKEAQAEKKPKAAKEPVSKDAISDAVWQELFDAGLTALQAATKRNMHRSSGYSWAQKMGLKWPTKTKAKPKDEPKPVAKGTPSGIYCRKCEDHGRTPVELVEGDNWWPSARKTNSNKCIDCYQDEKAAANKRKLFFERAKIAEEIVQKTIPSAVVEEPQEPPFDIEEVSRAIYVVMDLGLADGRVSSDVIFKTVKCPEVHREKAMEACADLMNAAHSIAPNNWVYVEHEVDEKKILSLLSFNTDAVFPAFEELRQH